MKKILILLLLLVMTFALFSEDIITLKMRASIDVKKTSESDNTFSVDVNDDKVEYEVRGATKIAQGLYSADGDHVVLVVNGK